MIENRYIAQDYVDSLSKSGYVHRHAIQVCAAGPLVYIRNLKSASTFFYRNLTQVYGWEEISWQDIDWRKHHVFGHLQDPVERRHKGVAEFIVMNQVQDLFDESQKFRNFIRHAPVFDEHTSSYHDTYGNLCYHIDWIPLQGRKHSEVIKATEKLLEHYGISADDRWNYEYVHVANPDKKRIELELKQLYEQETEPDWLGWYLHNDRLLHQTVVKKFDYNGSTWSQMSWLRIDS